MIRNLQDRFYTRVYEKNPKEKLYNLPLSAIVYMADKSIIEVKELTKKFGNLIAVDSISFSVKAGQIFGFLGPNGAGKTTTIKMLTTLLHQTSGYIRIYGYDPNKESHNVRQIFGIVFQDQSLDEELTAYENMAFHSIIYNLSKDIWKPRTEQLLKMVELWDRRNDLVKNFSGGMRRRLEITRGLVHHPKILYLDEPTLGLDPQTRNHIWNYIKDINKKEHIIVFFTTHYMEEAERVADTIAIIDHGKIIAKGSPSELKSKTKTHFLEEAFIKLTGRNIREEESSSIDRMRMRRKVFSR